MATEWKRVPLGEFVTLQRGHDLPDKSRRSGQVPILGSFGITGWHDVAKAKGPGVTVGRSGASFGVVSYSPADYWPLNTALYVIDFHGNDERFAYYFLQQFPFKAYNSGSAQPSLNRNFVHPVLVNVPPLAEQRAIARILGALDDKIELNRRISETLEAMVRALFKSWFVDFDPVRAKLEGRDSGLPKPIADLFPARPIDSELGEIPESWNVATIGEIADVIDCLHSKKPERRESGLPLLQLVNIRDDGLLDMTDAYLIDEADYRQWISRMEASPGDCVITNVGRVGAVSQIPIGQKAALGRNMTGVRCRRDFPFPTVLIELLLSRAMKDEITRKMDTGTILDALNVRNIPRLRFVRATTDVLKRFEQSVRPWRSRMEACLVESRTLTSLRDALLPKLVSGELRIKSAEPVVEDALA